MSVKFSHLTEFPDLIFGLVGPIGVDIEYIQDSLNNYLLAYDYDPVDIRLSELMQEISCSKEVNESSIVLSYNSKMEYANELRKIYDSNEILAAVAIGAIGRERGARKTSKRRGRAFIVRQLKTPDEVRLLREVYGRLFVQVSIYGDPEHRKARLGNVIRRGSNGLANEAEATKAASELISRDRKEQENPFGQNIIDAFPLGDVFIDSFDRESVNKSLDRFLCLLFGSNEFSPTRDEYGMYLAKTASLRSVDLSRQVGAAIFSTAGEVLSLGSNEVPKAGGGTYWAEDVPDARDIRIGHDPNEINKNEIFSDLISRLFNDDLLRKDVLGESENEAVSQLMGFQGGKKYRKSRVMDIIEFGRVIHAEMSAICDCARLGHSTKNTTLFCTTFPCHLCAKHIVAAGISRVVYLEPYPKSYAHALHGDSIQIESTSDIGKVKFQPFIGISPYRYRDLFERGRRKDDEGRANKWVHSDKRLNIPIVVPYYLETEIMVLAQLAKLLSSRVDE